MTHIGIICPSEAGHLNPMTNLGYELRKRGHKVTLFGIADTQSNASVADLDFWTLGHSEYPLGSLNQKYTQLGKLSGLSALRYTINWLTQEAGMRLAEMPEAFIETGVEGLLVDQVSPEGATVAEHLNIPFVTIANALIFNQEITIPPPFTNWKYSLNWTAQLRNRVGYAFSDRIGNSYRRVIDEYRREWSLKLHSRLDDNNSRLAQLSQQPAEFEFPRMTLPKSVHFTGPYHSSITRKSIDFPFEVLTGQPLIYASLGTVQNQLIWIFNTIAEACVGLRCSTYHFSWRSNEAREIRKTTRKSYNCRIRSSVGTFTKATLTITHAGLNTALESLSNGVPMVAIPITTISQE